VDLHHKKARKVRNRPTPIVLRSRRGARPAAPRRQGSVMFRISNAELVRFGTAKAGVAGLSVGASSLSDSPVFVEEQQDVVSDLWIPGSAWGRR